MVIAKLLWDFDVSRGEDDWDWNSQLIYFGLEKRPLYVRLSARKTLGSFTIASIRTLVLEKLIVTKFSGLAICPPQDFTFQEDLTKPDTHHK